MVLNNPSLAHIAGPGSQGSLKATGLRLMHRSTVPGQSPPTKRTNLKYFCQDHEPFQEGYCLYSLKVYISYRSRISFYIISFKELSNCKIINVHVQHRGRYSIHDMVNLKTLTNNEGDVKTFIAKVILQSSLMKNGTR